MKINSELRSIFNEARLQDILPSHIFDSESLAKVSIRVPQHFLPDVRVFSNREEITDEISEEGLKTLKSCVVQAKFNHFVVYHEQFKSMFYGIILEVSESTGVVTLKDVFSSEEP